MMCLSDCIINYKLVSYYDIKQLREQMVIPFKQDDFYIYLASSSESKTELFEQNMTKCINSPKNDILFYLNDIELRIQLFELCCKSISNENLNQEPINLFLERLLTFSYEKRASDIHFETTNDALSIRLRIDGKLKQFFLFDKELYMMLSSIIKLKCSLDITQKRKPLNGRFALKISNKKLDFRVSTMPTICGESIVLRILDEFGQQKKLSLLGFNNQQLKDIQSALSNSHGLILITGPTGSGKTTTLYSMLQQLNTQEKKIITIEDPIEYRLKNIQQIAVNNALGLTFHEILKNILRQDPDIIMIGEIRDKESLQIAFQAALTGHLVLSTLHTNDAISTLNRLYDLEAKPYIVANTLKSIISQRLVLKLCSCEKGCEKCNYTKFSGRIGISEVFTINDEIASLISSKENLRDIINTATKKGFISIKEDALQKIQQGITTEDEVYKVIGY